MKRRPKLSLTTSQGSNKKQALDLESAVSGQLEALAEKDAEAVKPPTCANGQEQAPGFETKTPNATASVKGGQSQRSTARGVGKDSVPQATARPGDGRLVTTFIVVLVAALSLYLLKRRLF